MVAWTDEQGVATSKWKRKKKFPLVIDEAPQPSPAWQPKAPTLDWGSVRPAAKNLIDSGLIDDSLESYSQWLSLPDAEKRKRLSGSPTIQAASAKAVDAVTPILQGLSIPWEQGVAPVIGAGQFALAKATGNKTITDRYDALRAQYPNWNNQGIFREVAKQTLANDMPVIRPKKELYTPEWLLGGQVRINPQINTGAAIPLLTDPLNVVGVGSAPVGAYARELAAGAKVSAQAAKQAAKQAAPVVGDAVRGIAEQGGRSIKDPFAPELGFAAGKAKKPATGGQTVPPSVPKAVSEVAKEPWQMTRQKYFEIPENISPHGGEAPEAIEGHFNSVKQALSEGRPVPPEVLKDYPDLIAKVDVPKSVETPKVAKALGIIRAKDPEIAIPQVSVKELVEKMGMKRTSPEFLGLMDDLYKSGKVSMSGSRSYPTSLYRNEKTGKFGIKQGSGGSSGNPINTIRLRSPDELASRGAPKPAKDVSPIRAVEPVTSQAPAPAASGGMPPVEPPKTAVNSDDVVRRFVDAINDKDNLKIVEADKAFKSQQMAAKAAKFMDNFTALRESGMAVEEAANKATAQLSGKLERKTMTLGDLFSPEERQALFDMVEQKSAGVPALETKSRISALTKALDEGIITDVKGKEGGSQRTRLEAVFGKPFVEAMETSTKKLQGTGRGQYAGGGKPLVPEVGRQGGLADIGDFVPTLEPQYAMGSKPPAPFAPVELSVGEQLKQAAFFNSGHVAEFPNFPEGSVGKQLAILPPTAREQAMSALKRVGVNAIDTLNVPRAFITAFDVSAPGRQGLQLLVAHPVSGYKNLGKMFKALASEKSAKASAEQVESILRRAGERARRLYIAPTELKSGLSGLSQAEESYMSRIAYKIPGVKRSQRAYVTFLNGMRADVFNQGMKAMEQLPIVELKDYDALSNLINAASGRGDLPKVLKNSSPVLNALMFSPRLVMARLEYVPRIVQAYATGNPVLAKEATRQLVTFLGFGASVIGLYKLAGGKVEGDPRSADFGKVTIGNSHVDIWGGYLQYSRVLARAATSSTKVNGKVRPQTLGTTLGDFAQSKFSPITSLFWDIGTGKDYSYNKMTASVDTLKTQSFNRLVPLFAQDLIEAIRLDGTATGIGMGALSGLGVGVTTYKNAQESVQYNTGGQFYPSQPSNAPTTPAPTYWKRKTGVK